MAKALSQRGLFEASQQEYRRVIDAAPRETPAGIFAPFELGELLHDQGRDREAAEALAPVVEAAKTDKQVRGSLKDLPLNPQARLYFFQACDSAARRDLDLQKSYLDEAIAADPNDADVLIALYDTSAGDPTRRARILKLVQAADGKFHAD